MTLAATWDGFRAGWRVVETEPTLGSSPSSGVNILVFEVRTKILDEDATVVKFSIESRRSSRKDAEQDVALMKLFGKDAWIVENDVRGEEK